MAKTKILVPVNQDPDASVSYNGSDGHQIRITREGVAVESELADVILAKIGFCVMEAPEEAPAKAAKPADAKPADAKPVDAKPAEAKPADAKPADADK
jgi:hypothetical protein